MIEWKNITSKVSGKLCLQEFVAEYFPDFAHRLDQYIAIVKKHGGSVVVGEHQGVLTGFLLVTKGSMEFEYQDRQTAYVIMLLLAKKYRGFAFFNALKTLLREAHQLQCDEISFKSLVEDEKTNAMYNKIFLRNGVAINLAEEKCYCYKTPISYLSERMSWIRQ